MEFWDKSLEIQSILEFFKDDGQKLVITLRDIETSLIIYDGPPDTHGNSNSAKSGTVNTFAKEKLIEYKKYYKIKAKFEGHEQMSNPRKRAFDFKREKI